MFRFVPGQFCPFTGTYRILNKYGIDTGFVKTVAQGCKFPPSPGKGCVYIL